MAVEKKEFIVKKEDAVFWMDGQGFWHNQHGRFEHKKIIRHFHGCIRWDGNSYYLEQDHGQILEKVYFPYEDTALFVFEVRVAETIVLVLNTGQKLDLVPEQLMVKADQLYLRMDGQQAKFTEHALMKISAFIEDKGERFFFVKDGRSQPIDSAEG